MQEAHLRINITDRKHCQQLCKTEAFDNSDTRKEAQENAINIARFVFSQLLLEKVS